MDREQARREAAREFADDLERRLAEAVARGEACRGCHDGEARAVLALLRKIALDLTSRATLRCPGNRT